MAKNRFLQICKSFSIHRVDLTVILDWYRAQAQACMSTIQGHGERCRLNVSSNLEDALDSSDGSD